MGNSNSSPPKEVSDDDHIKVFVSKLLDDKSANLTFVPDSIEAKMYEKLIRVLLANIKESLATVRIEFLGQVITLEINPIVDN